MCQEVTNHARGQSKHGLRRSSVKTKKFLPGAWQEWVTCTFWAQKIKTLSSLNKSWPNWDNSILLWTFMIRADTPTYGWVYGWADRWGSCQIMKNWINLDLIEIIQFCLKIYALWRLPPHGWVYGLVGGWVESAICNLNGIFSMCVCMHVWMDGPCTLTHTPTHPTYPSTPGSFKSFKWNISWTNWDNLILFADLWSMETPPPPPMGGCMCWWVEDWGHVIWFCLEIYDLWRLPPPMGGCMCWWVEDWGHVIWFCSEIYDLWKHCHEHTTHWSQSLAIEIMSFIHSAAVWFFGQLTYYP